MRVKIVAQVVLDVPGDAGNQPLPGGIDTAGEPFLGRRAIIFKVDRLTG
jgi:hypothetical protein